MKKKPEKPTADFLPGDYQAKPGESWPLHHAPMYRAHHRFLTARTKRPAHEICSDDPEVERELLAISEQALRAYFQGQWRTPRLELPHEIALFVADLLSEILAGGDPESIRMIRKARGGGSPKAAALERHHISAAVMYVKACGLGIVDDKFPNKTVRKHFRVAESTVRGWCQDPQWRGADLNSIQWPLNREPAEFVKRCLTEAGAAYQASIRTRAASAIDRRNRKRTNKIKE